MKAAGAPGPNPAASFRRRLLWTLLLAMGAAAVPVLLVAQRNLAEGTQREFERRFQNSLAGRHAAEELRHGLLAERARQLAQRSRIHAALEDGALDLLYPNAQSELADLAAPGEAAAADPGGPTLRARFYRFLDGRGRVIPAAPPGAAGALEPAAEAQLSLTRLPDQAQTGYLAFDDGSAAELILTPIASTETGENIAALVLGFGLPARASGEAAVAAGVFAAGRLYLPDLPTVPREDLERALGRRLGPATGDAGRFEFGSVGGPYSVAFQRLNPGSAYPPAFEVSVGSLADSIHRQHLLAWKFAGVGCLALALGIVASQIATRRLADPVERLAVDSEENRLQRHRAEAALETTSQELQRSVRFSADASHQLKTPVTVMRAGLEGLLAGPELTPAAREEVAGLVHQTYRLASLIEDLLLLSRLDAGRLQIQLGALNLAPVLEALVDDLGALAGPLQLEIETDLPPALWVRGERNYLTLILENLLENARKYNHPHGRIGIAAYEEGEWAVIGIGNSGPEIPASVQAHLFERFHRGTMGENVPGHGIGLNLARELARLHGGDLRLARTRPDWNEFELRLRRAPAEGGAGP